MFIRNETVVPLGSKPASPFRHSGHPGSPAHIRRHRRVPTAIQWIFPTPLAVLMFLAPESPWWLVRKGKLEQAARSVERLGRRSLVNGPEAVAMMRRVIEAESEHNPSILELFKGTDLRRTAIVCCVYLAQNLAGNLIANQAVFFFERELCVVFFRLDYC
jgi:SP family general alpha glucoside:H+ symporter-like MFS transporter